MDYAQWVQALLTVLVFISGGISAVAAYHARKVSAALPRSISDPTTPLLLTEAVPVASIPSSVRKSAEIAATILPWHPASYIASYSQQDEVLPDGIEDVERYNNCGETCCAMVIAGVWGVPVEPASLRQYLHGSAGTGLTDMNDLVKALRYCSVKAHAVALAGTDAWELIVRTVASQRPVICLGHWEGLGTFLHWIVVVSNGQETLQYVDPWNGSRSYLTHAQWSALEAGQLAVLDSHIHFDCRTWSNPR